MFEKRQASLKKLAAKQTRPVQPVAPHPESSPKRASPKTARPTSLGKCPSHFNPSIYLQRKK